MLVYVMKGGIDSAKECMNFSKSGKYIFLKKTLSLAQWEAFKVNIRREKREKHGYE